MSEQLSIIPPPAKAGCAGDGTTPQGRFPETTEPSGLSLRSCDFGLRCATPEPVVSPPSAADLGGIIIRRLIGEGGMGRVYEATQPRPSRQVAVKILRPEAASETNARRLAREAEVLAALEHPGIAQVFLAGTYTDSARRERPYIVLEYLPDARPIVRWAEFRCLDLRSRLTLFREACHAVAHAHARDVVHRDLKPANILVSGDGRLKVVDFGIASHPALGPTYTRDGATGGLLAGTPAYMSPEQREGTADTRTDVYALGIVLAELVTGKPPAAAQADLVARRDRLGTIARKCLAIDPGLRYGTAAGLAEDVAVLVAEPTASARAEPRRTLRAVLATIVAVQCALLIWLAAGHRLRPVISRPLLAPLPTPTSESRQANVQRPHHLP